MSSAMRFNLARRALAAPYPPKWNQTTLLLLLFTDDWDPVATVSSLRCVECNVVHCAAATERERCTATVGFGAMVEGTVNRKMPSQLVSLILSGGPQ